MDEVAERIHWDRTRPFHPGTPAGIPGKIPGTVPARSGKTGKGILSG